MLFYPCIADSSGQIRKKLLDRPVSHEEAVQYIKKHYWRAWLRCDAIPQPVSHPYFRR